MPSYRVVDSAEQFSVASVRSDVSAAILPVLEAPPPFSELRQHKPHVQVRQTLIAITNQGKGYAPGEDSFLIFES